MAINFSASFAACLAAGLKVPRQIMYCISQDTGAPYVLYKDSQDAAVDRGGGAATAITATGQWTPDMYSTALQQQQQQQHAQQQLSPQQAHQQHHHTTTTTTANVHQQQTAASSVATGGGPQSPTGHEENGGSANDPPPPHGDPHGALSSPATSPYSQTNTQDLDDDVTMSQVGRMIII